MFVMVVVVGAIVTIFGVGGSGGANEIVVVFVFIVPHGLPRFVKHVVVGTGIVVGILGGHPWHRFHLGR